MRILIHGINFSPELTGIGKYSGEMAEWFASRGHQVRVVTAPPYYPQWKLAEGYSNFWHRTDFSPSVGRQDPASNDSKYQIRVYRCPLWVPNKPTGLKRVLHLASFTLLSFPVMLMQIVWRPDLVLVVEPPLFCAPQAWLVARLSGGKTWLHIQDLEVDAGFNLGLMKGVVLRRLILAFEQWVVHHFDRVSTISVMMVERVVGKGVEPERIVLFRNWVEKIKEKDAPNIFRSELNIPLDAVVALYSGTMGGKQGLEIMGEAAKLLREYENIVFVFCGNGVGRTVLEAQCEGLTNVRFLDLQPVDRLVDLLLMADLHLLPQRASAADLVMPSKLTGMLASARPVVVTAKEGTKLASVVKDCGLVVEPEEAKGFADAIYKLASDPELRNKLGKAGRTYADTVYDKETVLQKVEAEILTLIKAK